MDSADEIRVFVYGTLKPGGYYWPRFCEGRVTSATRARVRGQLFALPVGYPALTYGDGWASGYLLTLRDRAVLAGFDTLESYDPSRPHSENEYERVEMDVHYDDGSSAGRAWAYVMDIDRINRMDGVLVASGDWDVDDPDILPSFC